MNRHDLVELHCIAPIPNLASDLAVPWPLTLDPEKFFRT